MASKDTEPIAPALRRLLWRWAFVLGALGVFAVWATWRMSTAASRLPELSASAASTGRAEPQIEYWTCTMHPEVRQPGPGNCPICSMKLVPKYAGSDEPGVAPPQTAHAGHAAKPAAEGKQWYRCTMPECGDVGSDDPNSRCPVCGMKREPVGPVGGETAGKDEVALGERARRLAAVATEPVARRYLFNRIRTVGTISYDETRHKMVSAWIAGRIDKLFADFTGMVVEKGDHLVEIYSPELLSAQEEYLQALRSAEGMRSSGIEASRRSAEQLLHSSRRKLELLGVTEPQIKALEESGTPQTHLVVYAPLGGTVVGKPAMEGMYVKTGDVLYEIADLTHVWLLVDVYEADLPWVRPFQDVLVTAEALPGERFYGQIAFVDPVIDPSTRTTAVRVNVFNPERRLKPEMFVTVEIAVPMGADARAVAPQPDGSYACPMHPWETANAQADCPVCEMPMVPIASIPGYTPPGAPREVLSVPRTAVLQTGERALAYVELEPGRYRGVAVTVGPLARAKDGREYYPVLAGLDEGQSVVTRGNFAVDSQAQLAGKPSLFQPGSADAGPSTRPEAQAGDMAETASDTPPAPEQTTCPVMVGNPIDKEAHVDYHGVRVYFCCPGCDKKFLANPDAYIPNLPPAIQKKIRAAADREKRTDD